MQAISKARVWVWACAVCLWFGACLGSDHVETPQTGLPTKAVEPIVEVPEQPDQPAVRVLSREEAQPVEEIEPPEVVVPSSLTIPKGALDKLRDRVSKRGGKPLVVAHYGDSHSNDGSLALALREHLSGGVEPLSPAFVTPSSSRRWNARVKRGGKWTRQNWLRKNDQGPFGPMGLAWVTSESGATLTLSLRDGPALKGTSVDLFYARRRGHLPFKVSASGKVLASITSRKAPKTEPELGRVRVEMPEGATEVVLTAKCRSCRDDDSLRVFGFQVRSPGSRVEWDNFGIISTAVRHVARRADGMVKDYLKWRDPDLLLIWYGANSVPPRDRGFDLEKYKVHYREAIKILRAGAPKASCLLVGPPDMAFYPEKTCFMNKVERWIVRKKRRSKAERKKLRFRRTLRACEPDKLVHHHRGKVVYPGHGVNTKRQWQAYKKRCEPYSPPLLPDLIETQKAVAAELGCAYFDSYQAMGGAGTIKGWTCEDPPRASGDLVHMTKLGYGSVAQSLVDELGRASIAAPLVGLIPNR